MPDALPPILGHSAQVRALWDALAADRLHHAWLFEGPSGVGRHLVATRLAMAANCEAEGLRPCGACGSCRRIHLGNHPDVITVTTDSESASAIIKVDRIREVIRAATYHRYSARRRFVIIDPAEAMNPAGANALLKTLEEPNAGTHFVLIAQHASALLPTIVSRCQRLRFMPVPTSTLAAWLTERGVEQAERVATLAEGRPGRAITLAEQGLSSWEDLRAGLLGALAGDLEGIFDFVEGVTEGGRTRAAGQIEGLLAIIEDLLRDAVVWAASAGADPTTLGRRLVHADRPDVISAWADALWPGGVTTCERLLVEIRAAMAVNVQIRTLLDALLTTLATELGAARRAGS